MDFITLKHKQIKKCLYLIDKYLIQVPSCYKILASRTYTNNFQKVLGSCTIFYLLPCDIVIILVANQLDLSISNYVNTIVT